MIPVRALIVDDEPLARERLRTLLPRDAAELVGEAWSKKTAVDAIRRLRPDLCFLDVELPDGTGFDVLRELTADALPLTVFVTAYESYAVRAFDAAAIDYVVKPVERERFDAAVRRAVAQLRSSAASEERAAQFRTVLQALQAARARERIVLREDGRSHFVQTADIHWIEAKRNNCLVHLAGRTIVVRETLQSLLARLPSREFVRAHRSTIVNVAHVRYAEPWFRGEHVLVLSDGTRVVTSRGMGSGLHKLLNGR